MENGRKGKGRPSKIADSPYRQEVEEMIKEGKSPAKISKWLKEEKDFSVSSRAVERFRSEHIPEVSLIHPSILSKRLEGIDRKIDEMDELLSLYLIQSRRIDKNLDREESKGELIVGTGLEISLARNLLFDQIKLKQDLGLMPKGASSPVAGGINLAVINQQAVNNVCGPSIKDVLEHVPVEEKRNFINNLEQTVGSLESGDSGSEGKPED